MSRDSKDGVSAPSIDRPLRSVSTRGSSRASGEIGASSRHAGSRSSLTERSMRSSARSYRRSSDRSSSSSRRVSSSSSSRRFSDRRNMRGSISIASRNRERVLLEFNHGPPAEFNLEPLDERSLLSSDSTSFNPPIIPASSHGTRSPAYFPSANH